ncbi:MAG: hypothetical protein IJC94_01270 [Oscillospiraceae bacterium]|nr:hypothetical protein [Oscillospiraceae bacterium]
MSYIKHSGNYICKEAFRQGIKISYDIWVPDVVWDRPFALLVTHDGLNTAEADVMLKLAESGEAPYCIVIGMGCGLITPAYSVEMPKDVDQLFGQGLISEDALKQKTDDFVRMRLNNYDFYSPDFVNFIIDELIPYATEKFSLNISDNPDMHMISGGSSGGIAAWNGVWFRNDYFRRVYMSTPTFSAIARGNMAPVQIRLFETKPIRAYIDWSEFEPDDIFGSSYCAAMEGKMALEFAGYDYQWEYHPGEGHCSRGADPDFAEKRMRFLWKDWQTVPVKPLRYSKYVESIVYTDEAWTETDSFPETVKALTQHGEYKIKDNKIVLCSGDNERVVAEGFTNLTSVAVASDLWRLYIADSAKQCLYFAMIGENGDLINMKHHSVLQNNTDFDYPGATDLCVDCIDRFFAATELGVQVVRSFGFVDAIFPLPQNAVPKRVALVKDVLYAHCGEKIFCRRVKTPARENLLVPTQPKYNGYGC